MIGTMSYRALDALRAYNATHAPVAAVEASAVQPECTEEQGATWQERHSDGYRAGRGDARRGADNRIELIEVPAQLPRENGAQYVARHVGIAWQIGYAEAWRYEMSR